MNIKQTPQVGALAMDICANWDNTGDQVRSVVYAKDARKLESALTQSREEVAKLQATIEDERQHWREKLDEVVSEKRDVVELRRLLDEKNGLIHQVRSQLRESGFPDRIKMGEDLHGNEDWAPVRVESMLTDCLTQLESLRATVATLQRDKASAVAVLYRAREIVAARANVSRVTGWANDADAVLQLIDSIISKVNTP